MASVSPPSTEPAVGGYPAHVWALISQLLREVQNDDHLQQITQRFELTRDPLVDRAQRNSLARALQPKLKDLPDAQRLGRGHGDAIITAVYDELLGISVLGPFWRDDRIDEILVDAWDVISIESGGALHRTTTTFRDAEHARSVARSLAAKVSDRSLTASSPIVDAELPGARVAFAIDKVAKTGLAIAIRKARPLLGVAGLLHAGAFDEPTRAFLEACVHARANIVVSGGTSSGKTTIINALSAFIPSSERVITIEDTYELQLTNLHRVHLQTKGAASADDRVSVTMADLLVTTLRMRPDRVIVGEIRDGKAATVMMDAANTGHDGTMTTIHANSAEQAINFRLVQLLRRGSDMGDDVARNEIASAVDLVIQVIKRQGKRFISEIAVVDATQREQNQIRIVPLITGTVIAGPDGTAETSFRRVGSVSADTDLAMKLADNHVAGNWIETTEVAP